MRPKSVAKLSVSLSLLALGLAGNALAQQVLPRPDPPLKGTIGQTSWRDRGWSALWRECMGILGRLGANDRTHAVTIALKRGIIELEMNQ